MGETVHCESFLPLMRDLTEDSNSCSWSMSCGDKNLPYGQYQNGFSMKPATNSSYSEYGRDFLKQTMIEHEAVFKNQVYELHRLYKTQKSLMDEVRGNKFIEDMNQSERTPESAIRRELPRFLLGNSICGEGSSSQACNVPMQHGISSKDEEVLKVRPVKVRRKMYDLQLPPHEYLDTDGENTCCPPYEQSKARKEVGEKIFLERGNASHRNGSSGSSLALKNTNGLTDLNEPVQCQESVPDPISKDIYSLYGRNIAHAQGQWLDKSTSQNGWMVLKAGHGKSTPGDKLCLPSHSVQVLSNSAFHPLGYPSTDQRKLSGEKSCFEWDARQWNPEVSYDSYVESSVASNAPSLQHGYHAESVRPWSHWISSWENQSSSSVQKSLPLQTNPFLNFNTQARADSSSEMRCRDIDGRYQGFSSGSKETAFNFPSGNFNHLNNGPKWVSEAVVKRNLDINLPCEASVSEAVVVDKEQGKRHDIDLNLCASEDEDSSLCCNSRVDTKTSTLIDLEALPTLESDEEREKLLEKRDEETWGSEEREAGDSMDEFIKAAAEAIVTISLSHHCSTDEAASSSTDAVAKDPLSWFVNTIASCGNDLEKQINACFEARECEGCREECSSGESDYFEAMTLNLPLSKGDYMPEPLVPEHLKFHGTGPMGITANRPRRGQARRGRPRRDFQRDILPGLGSLSRLEVTEDLQMFGGLMKATGYNWNSGEARRSSNRGGSSRGRKRLVSNISRGPVCSSSVQPMNNSVQMMGLEDRSLTGWGNATRRPRRQRCPAGTLPTVILT